jgi:hypothetical protein
VPSIEGKLKSNAETLICCCPASSGAGAIKLVTHKSAKKAFLNMLKSLGKICKKNIEIENIYYTLPARG